MDTTCSLAMRGIIKLLGAYIAISLAASGAQESIQGVGVISHVLLGSDGSEYYTEDVHYIYFAQSRPRLEQEVNHKG